jgi:hypothetical protein
MELSCPSLRPLFTKGSDYIVCGIDHFLSGESATEYLMEIAMVTAGGQFSGYLVK